MTEVQLKMENVVKIVMFVLLLVLSGSSFGEYTYDYETGNEYSTKHDGSNTYVDGYNSETGRNWGTTIKSDGNMNGFDGDGNYWDYSKGSDTYYNYGTGELRSMGVQIYDGN